MLFTDSGGLKGLNYFSLEQRTICLHYQELQGSKHAFIGESDVSDHS